jgi:hypothetical protein
VVPSGTPVPLLSEGHSKHSVPIQMLFARLQAPLLHAPLLQVFPLLQAHYEADLA